MPTRQCAVTRHPYSWQAFYWLEYFHEGITTERSCEFCAQLPWQPSGRVFTSVGVAIGPWRAELTCECVRGLPVSTIMRVRASSNRFDVWFISIARPGRG
jgi:hypothetical protein